MKYSIGVDIGGTNLRLGVVDYFGKVSSLLKTKTPKNHKKLLDIIFNYIKNTKENYSGIGIAIATPVNQSINKIRWSDKFKYPRNFNLIKDIEQVFNKKVLIENDLNATTLAEMNYGALINKKNAIAITVSTGIGSGIVINGSIYRGYGNGAGEIGHTPLNTESKMKCNLGHIGDWESLASAKSLEKRYYLSTGNMISAKEIVSLAKLKNGIAKKNLKETSFYLGVGLSGVINSFSPEAIVVCGDFFNEVWLMQKKEIIKEVKKRIIVPSPIFIKSKLGDNAGVIGAASLVFNS